MTKQPLATLICIFLLAFIACREQAKGDSIPPNNIILNSLTKKGYKTFVREIFKAYQQDPQAVGEQAKQIIIGMTGFENRPESHSIFEVDVNFNVNSMFLLVANANKIKRSSGFIDEFKKQMKSTRSQLKTEIERTYFDVFTILLLNEQANL